jgi:hypothetical protein
VATLTPKSSTDALIDAQLAARIAALKKQNESTLANLAKTLSTTLANLTNATNSTNAAFKTQKNQAAANSDIGAYNFAQNNAARGVEGPAAGMPDIYRTIGLQNALSAIGAQQAAALSTIDQEKALAQNAYETDYTTAANQLEYDLATAGADSEAQKAAAQIAALTEAQAAAKALAAETKTDWTNNTGQFSDNYQAEINRIDGLMAQGQDVDADGLSLAYKRMVLESERNAKVAAIAAQAAKAKANVGKLPSPPKLVPENAGTADFNAVRSDAIMRLDNGATPDELADYILGKMGSGQLSPAAAKQLALELGINI